MEIESVQLRTWNSALRAKEARSSPNSKRDENQLARLGKRQIMRRNFGFTGIVGFTTSILMTWEGLLLSFFQGLQNGGPAGAVYGFLCVWAGLAATFAILSELASMAPIAGGQYHWCSMLAAKRVSKFSSYITGWLTVVGWQVGLASGYYNSAMLTRGLLVLTRPDFTPHPWQVTLIFWAVAALCVIINVVGGPFFSKLEGLIFVLHIVFFFGVLIPMLYMSDLGTPQSVFETWNNGGGWPTPALSSFVGLIGVVYALAGGDAAIHMAEETQNAQKVIPMSLMYGLMINGTLGFAMLIAILFCLGNVEDALNTPTGAPILEIFTQGTGSIAGACLLGSILVIASVFCNIGLLATASRQLWAFSRDRGVPGWRHWSKVSSKTNIPVNSVLISAGIALLFSLIPLGSLLAFDILTSMFIASLYLSYTVCCILLLYRRCTGGILETVDHQSSNSPPIMPGRDEHLINTPGARLVWGPFHLKGIFGIVVNILAIVFLLITIFFSFWPPTAKVTAATMNYSAFGNLGILIFAIGYYMAWAKKEYEGPIIDL